MPDIWLATAPRVTSDHRTLSTALLGWLPAAASSSGTYLVTGSFQYLSDILARIAYTETTLEMLAIRYSVSGPTEWFSAKEVFVPNTLVW